MTRHIYHKYFFLCIHSAWAAQLFELLHQGLKDYQMGHSWIKGNIFFIFLGYYEHFNTWSTELPETLRLPVVQLVHISNNPNAIVIAIIFSQIQNVTM